jgi:hypothetical protein
LKPKTLAIVGAVLLLLLGALMRARSLNGLSVVFQILATLRSPTASDLGFGLVECRPGEIAGEVLVALGSALLALAAAPALRSMKVAGAAVVLFLAAGAGAVLFPATNVAGALILDKTNAHFFYPQSVALGDVGLHVFVLKDPDRAEWYVEDDVRGMTSRLDAPDLEAVLAGRLAQRQRPVTVFVVDSCPAKRREEFLAAAKRACDGAGVSCKAAALPTPEQQEAAWHAEAYARREPFANLALAGTVGRVLSAAGFLLLAVVLVRGKARGALVAGVALLAAASLLATPVPLYDAVGPDASRGSPSFQEAAANLGLYRSLVYLSAAALAAGAIASAIGLKGEGVTAEPAPPPARRRRPRRPEGEREEPEA